MSGASGPTAPLDGGQAEMLLLTHPAGPQAQVEQWKGQFSVPELRRLLRIVKARIEQKSTDLRDLVGAEYRQVIAAADSIVHINNNACHMASHFACMRDLLAKQGSFLPVTQSPLTPLPDLRSPVTGGATELPPNNLAAVAAQIKLLVDIPELIWKALDHNQVLSGAILYLLADKTYQSLQAQALSKDASTDVSTVFTQFPLAERQWDLIAHFRARILVRCDELLSCADDLPLPTVSMQQTILEGPGRPGQALRALCAIALLQSQSLDQLLDHFLACRLTALETAYHDALSDAASNAVAVPYSARPSGSPSSHTAAGETTAHPMAHAVLMVLMDTLLLFSPEPHIQRLWSPDADNSPDITQPPSFIRSHRVGLLGRDRANTIGLAQSPPTRSTALFNQPHCVVTLILHCLSTVDKQPLLLRMRSGSMSPALPKGDGREESSLTWLIRHWGPILFPNLPRVGRMATLPLLTVIQRSLSAPTTNNSRPSMASQHPVSRQPSLGAAASRALGGDNWGTILARDSHLPIELRLFQPHWRPRGSSTTSRTDTLTPDAPATTLSVKNRLQRWLAQLVDQCLVTHTQAWLQHQATEQLITLLSTPFWDRAALSDDPKHAQSDLQASCVQVLASYLQTHQSVTFRQPQAVALVDALWATLSVSLLPLVDQVVTRAVVDGTCKLVTAIADSVPSTNSAPSVFSPHSQPPQENTSSNFSTMPPIWRDERRRSSVALTNHDSKAAWSLATLRFDLHSQLCPVGYLDGSELGAHNRQFMTLLHAVGPWLKRYRRIQSQIRGVVTPDTALSASALPDQLLEAYAGAIQQAVLLRDSEESTTADLDTKVQAIFTYARALPTLDPSASPLAFPPFPVSIQDALVNLERVVNLQRLDSATWQACQSSKPLRTACGNHTPLLLRNGEHLLAQYSRAVAPVALWVAAWFLHRWQGTADHAYRLSHHGTERTENTRNKVTAPSPFIAQMMVHWYELMARLGAEGWLLSLGSQTIALTTLLALCIGVQGFVRLRTGTPKAIPTVSPTLDESADGSQTLQTLELPDQLDTWLTQAPWTLTGLTLETVHWRQLLVDFKFARHCFGQSAMGGLLPTDAPPQIGSTSSQAIMTFGNTCAQQLWALVRDKSALVSSVPVPDTFDGAQVNQICTTTFNQLRQLLVAIRPH